MITSGNQINYAKSPDQITDLGNGLTTGGKWVGGAYQTLSPGNAWGPNGEIVNISQYQQGQQAQTQAKQDLAGLGSPAEIAAQSSAAADPFAGQRGQYQNSLANLMNGQFTPNDPSYQFRVGQGQQALERSGAAKGFLGSGNMLAELQKYGQDMGSQEYQNQYNRLLPLTGAQSGSPAAAGTAIAATYGWRNNALANLGGAQSLQGGMGGGMGGGTSGSLQFPGSGGAGGSPFGGSGGNSMNAASGGGVGSGISGGGYSGSNGSLGTTAAESNNALARQMAAQYPSGGGYSGGGGAPTGGGWASFGADGSSASDIPMGTGNITPSAGNVGGNRTFGGGGTGVNGDTQDQAAWRAYLMGATPGKELDDAINARNAGTWKG